MGNLPDANLYPEPKHFALMLLVRGASLLFLLFLDLDGLCEDRGKGGKRLRKYRLGQPTSLSGMTKTERMPGPEHGQHDAGNERMRVWTSIKFP